MDFGVRKTKLLCGRGGSGDGWDGGCDIGTGVVRDEKKAWICQSNNRGKLCWNCRTGVTLVILPLSPFLPSSHDFIRPFMGNNLTFQKYQNMGHTISDQEADHIVQWVAQQVQGLGHMLHAA